jgi:nucleoid DNA-binding protein
MRTSKLLRKFYFKDEKKLWDSINKKFPLKINKLSSIVEKVSERYPAIGKDDVAIIIKAMCECLREVLIKGGIIAFSDLFTTFKLSFERNPGRALLGSKNDPKFIKLKANLKLKQKAKQDVIESGK